MTITHIVLLQFKEDVKADDVKTVCQQFSSLKDNCIHPTTQTPYILSVKGGKDHSSEGLQSGITHGFVVEFASTADRDYYIKTDPVHLAFAKSIGAFVTKVIVVDFTGEEY
ncbi:stress responsive a b barrel domain containing protein [Grosmannia clavigera kw1407]|uniref:Stress responsive a b barrel domain containing protein n=1 Tax=Grosmannia clavigera (strain kw1407 / UAMH 11150) TaxID=655863 RepID=F0XHW1_GROCL|nr:stress responsive a b barrel domain containing protein [Grosmannia clavigera kw1407]EFX03226.1 stress responsive a b barrel domain containing protein [Grosmannia clavigera kw1407]